MRSSRRSKRGAIEIQFNWLFVLIIGAVILTIFTTIILKQKKTSEVSQNALLLRQLDSTLSGTEATPGLTSVITIPQATIEFRCNRYSIGGLSKQVDIMSVFTPSTLTTRQLISTTQDWSLPFRVTNVLYLTAPSYRYILVGSSRLTTTMYEMMPNETFVEQLNVLGNIKHRGEAKVRFVFFDNGVRDGTQVPGEYLKMADEDVSALLVSGDENIGAVEFFMKDGDVFRSIGSSDYIKTETLMGAIITDTPNVYTCIMNNLFDKLHIVSDIYLEKARAIRTEYQSTADRCAQFRTTAYNLNALTQISNTEFTRGSMQQLLTAENQLKQQNRRAQEESCATIY